MTNRTTFTRASATGNLQSLVTNYNANLDALEIELENSLSRKDNILPNSMENELDMNGNDIINVNEINVSALTINGTPVQPFAGVTVASAFQSYTFTATLGQTSFSIAPFTAYVASVQVEVNGLSLPPADISVSGTNVIIPACTAGDEVVIRRYTSAPSPFPSADDITYTPAGTINTRSVQNKLQESVSVKDFGAVGDGVADDTAAINLALAASSSVYFPAGTYMTDGGHNIQGKSLIGFNRDMSIIKARGTNSGVTIFTGARNSPSSPGTWGSGGAFRLENLGIHGNWNGTSGLTLVGSYNTGVLAENYNATLNTALVKGVSTVYTFIKNCQFAFAYEHALMFYGNGYSEVDGNIFTTCRGSAIWFAGDKTSPATEASSISTSTTIEDNQITTCRGGNGALIMFLTYGVTVRGNLFEANVYGYNAEEGADCSFFGNYSELGYIVGDNVGIAPVLISPDIWGHSFVGEAYNPLGNYIPAAPRSAVSIDRSGVRVFGQTGYGGVGYKFPATQAPSSDVNTLDDYKEGTFTPTVVGVTLDSANGHYTKIGNLVTVNFSVTFPAAPALANCLVSNLPYSSATVSGVALSSAGGRASIDFYATTNVGESYISFVNAAGTAFMSSTDFAGKTLSGTVTYLV